MLIRLPCRLKDIFNLWIKMLAQTELMMNQDIQRYQQRRYVAPGD
jgi:hypothetical protein